jgi:hypothetical protein
MISEWSPDRTGWARFSPDRVMRYRLARSLRPGVALEVIDSITYLADAPFERPTRVCFLMLNPSTADAFQLDPTVNECRKRAVALGADILEVVNLFAFRSPYPEDLKTRKFGERGDGVINDDEIFTACRVAHIAVAAWGNHGMLDRRAQIVTGQLMKWGIELWHLGKTADGSPKHPLARGKHRIPTDLQLERYIP